MPLISSVYRFRKSLSWALYHLLLSAFIAALMAWLVIGVWFPGSFIWISGGVALFLTVIVVDVVCGPLLTLLLIRSEKSRKALFVDMLLIAVIQVSALIFGINTFAQGRPVAIVFEVDRFHVISPADIDNSKPESIPDWAKPWNAQPMRMIGVRNAKDGAEKMESVDASLQGVEPGQRPWWWQDYALSVPQVKERAKPLNQLLSMHPESVSRIQEDALRAAQEPREHETADARKLLWLPLVSRHSMDWVALIDPYSARIRGYSHADGFYE